VEQNPHGCLQIQDALLGTGGVNNGPEGDPVKDEIRCCGHAVKMKLSN